MHTHTLLYHDRNITVRMSAVKSSIDTCTVYFDKTGKIKKKESNTYPYDYNKCKLLISLASELNTLNRFA